MRVLVVNTGSSSLKLRLLDGDDTVESTLDLENWAGDVDTGDIAGFLAEHGDIDAVGHRVVHGGAEFRDAVVLTPSVRRRIADLSDLAPIHQPRALSGINAIDHLLPESPTVACFDTTFHTTLPAAAATYALPAAWRERWNPRRYGFHGLSHAYAARRAARLTNTPIQDLRIVTCHLGAGASLAAVDRGRSVDTTMGFTPLEGLVMATRSGDVDPGLLLWLLEHEDISAAEARRMLDHESGLAGLSGTTGDIRDVYANADDGDHGAALALDVYVHRLRAGIAAMAAAMNGLDILVFTGGVGENQPRIRAAATEGLEFLGVALDPVANTTGEPDRAIGSIGARVHTFVIAAREDLEIARQTRAVLRRSPAGDMP